MKVIAWFEELGKDNIDLAGGKGANLGELLAAGLPVPNGFVVTAETYKDFIEETDIKTDIDELLKDLDVNNNEQLNSAAKAIKGMIKAASMPDSVKEDIIKAYNEFDSEEILIAGSDVEPGEFVAVRSSATAEDLPGASFAGQQRTFLNVKGKTDLIEAVKGCWASLFEPRAIYYRQKKGFDHEKVYISVIIQKMVDSDKAGVMFTVNPAESDESKISIDAAWGLGEAIVGGEVTPDNYVVDKKSMQVVSKNVSEKPFMYTRDLETGKTKKVNLSEETAKKQVLTEDEIKELAEYGKQIEKHYGYPQDIEWALEDSKIYIVQSRPVTTLAGRDEKESEKMPENVEQILEAEPEEKPGEAESEETKKESLETDIPFKSEESEEKKTIQMPAAQGLVKKSEEKEQEKSEPGEKPAEPTEEKSTERKPIVKGFDASPGIGAGKVKIIHSASELSKIEKGDILVTKMTTPDMVPAMERAAAIVTNSGGTTCFTGDTTVLTNSGFMEMQEVYKKIEDGRKLRVLSVNKDTLKAEWKPVNASMKRRAKVWTVSISQTGRSERNTLTLTPDHKMLTFRRRNLIKRKISDILENDEMLCLVDKIPSEYEFSEKEKKLAYLVGAVSTDGYIQVTNRRGRVVFTQKPTQDKRDFISTVSSYFKELFDYSLKERKKSTFSTIRGKDFSGSAADYTCTKKAPAQLLLRKQNNLVPWLLRADLETVGMFLGGVVDGDGSFSKGRGHRLNIYCGNSALLQAILVSCLRMEILPQVTTNRNIYNVQIVEGIEKILKYTKRVKGKVREKMQGTKLFSAKQLFSDIIDEVNWKGTIRPYVNKNLLIDSRKIHSKILPMLNQKSRTQVKKIINSNLRMQRVRKIKENEVRDVYNIEVDENHNYVVFTEFLTPVLVNNCHAAIVSRELGIPCIVGTGNATSVLKDHKEVTVDARKGVVYDGIVGDLVKRKEEEKKTKEISVEKAPVVTATKIYVNLGIPDKAEEVSKLPVDGVGLMREEFIFASLIGEHPLALIEKGEQQKFVDTLADGIQKVAKAFKPRQVVLRLSDFKTNEYHDLKGGEKFEQKEDNPMLGWRGCSRYTSKKYEPAFRLELKAVKKVRDKGYKNIAIMLPFVRTTEDVKSVSKMMEEEGLERGPDLKLWMMAEVPSNVLLADEFAKLVDGFSIGSNDLTQLIMGADRDSRILEELGYFNENDPAVKKAISHLIKTAHENKCTISICGQKPSTDPDFARFLVKEGIDSISINADVAVKTKNIIASEERKILLGKVREGEELTEKEKKEINSEF